MKIKICGIRREEDVWMLNESMPDYAGFVFADTRRKVTAEQALKLRQQLDRKIPVFGVFVNAPLSVVCDRVRDGCIDHGRRERKDEGRPLCFRRRLYSMLCCVPHRKCALP